MLQTTILRAKKTLPKKLLLLLRLPIRKSQHKNPMGRKALCPHKLRMMMRARRVILMKMVVDISKEETIWPSNPLKSIKD